MRVAVPSLAMLVAIAASGACAQPPPSPPGPPEPVRTKPPRDLIGELINPNAAVSRDEDEPDTAGQPRSAIDVEPAPPLAIMPSGPPLPFAAPPRPQLSGPVSVDDVGKTPDGPPSVRDLAYDSRIRASFASAESFQGRLDGGWTLSAAGQDLFILQLVDRRDRLEGVWRDPRRKGSPDASGLIDEMQRQGGVLTLRFAASSGAPMTVATLRESGGQWSGDLVEGGASRTVVLRRTSP